MKRLRVLVLLALTASACGGERRAGDTSTLARGEPAELGVFAEGPCPKLSVEAAGDRRFLVYGDHGRVLAGWMPGDRVHSAESIAELRGGRAFVRPSLLRGLPRDSRGWVPGELRLGGTADDPWLVRTTLRYSLRKRGPLFERTPTGYRFESGWRKASTPVTVPEPARRLPALPIHEMCGDELAFVPLTWTATPKGGLVVAGRCDDKKPANYAVNNLLVAHGAPGASQWRVTVLPPGAPSGIVNLDSFAAGDDEVYVSAYEPFTEPDARTAYLARWNGSEWSRMDVGAHDGIMAVTGDGRGTLWLAGGRALYRVHDGALSRMSLPPLASVPANTRLHIHSVRYLQGELWVEASYRVRFRDRRGAHWASALFSSRRAEVPIFCDAREPVETALFEAKP